MNVLALDTASPEPAVTWLADGAIHDRRLPSDRRVSQELLPAVEECLGKAGATLADCHRIAVASGPGSFTGLRIGLATAWGLGRALGVPVEAVSTLEALAETARGSNASPVLAALDAGRGEVVLSEFVLDSQRARVISPMTRLSYAQAIARSRDVRVVCLPGDLLTGSGGPPSFSLSRAIALAVARCPRETEAGRLVPIYARPSAAEEKRGAS